MPIYAGAGGATVFIHPVYYCTHIPLCIYIYSCYSVYQSGSVAVPAWPVFCAGDFQKLSSNQIFFYKNLHFFLYSALFWWSCAADNSIMLQTLITMHTQFYSCYINQLPNIAFIIFLLSLGTINLKWDIDKLKCFLKLCKVMWDTVFPTGFYERQLQTAVLWIMIYWVYI